MEQLGSVLQIVLLGLCLCGLGIGGLVAVFLGFTGGGIMTAIKDVLGIGQRDEDDIIDEAVSSIHQKRRSLKTKRDKVAGDGGIPDFDAAVAKFSQQPNRADDDSFSAQSANKPGAGIRGLGGGKRFSDSGGGLRGKRSSRNDDYEIYDDGE